MCRDACSSCWPPLCIPLQGVYNAGANIGPSGDLRASLFHALKFNDFYHDTVHQVTPLTLFKTIAKCSSSMLLCNLIFGKHSNNVVSTQFAPTYHDYTLYNHNDGKEGATKYRSRTFVPTGQARRWAL